MSKTLLAIVETQGLENWVAEIEASRLAFYNDRWFFHIDARFSMGNVEKFSNA